MRWLEALELGSPSLLLLRVLPSLSFFNFPSALALPWPLHSTWLSPCAAHLLPATGHCPPSCYPAAAQACTLTGLACVPACPPASQPAWLACACAWTGHCEPCIDRTGDGRIASTSTSNSLPAIAVPLDLAPVHIPDGSLAYPPIPTCSGSTQPRSFPSHCSTSTASRSLARGPFRALAPRRPRHSSLRSCHARSQSGQSAFLMTCGWQTPLPDHHHLR